MMSMAITHSGVLTRADLDALRPSEGSERYELLDGAILVTPGPWRWHQSMVVNLTVLLRSVRTTGLVVLVAPFDVVLGADTVLQPDVLVARESDLTDKDLPASPLLVVEVLSRSTRGIDQVLKRERYARAGIPSYWIVDPTVPSVQILELPGRSRAQGENQNPEQHPRQDLEQGIDYQEVGSAAGTETIRLQHPFPVEFSPAQLLVE